MSTAVDVKTLIIDGMDVSARQDQTVLDVARENNIFIPTLCHLEGLTEVGACRLCLVEIKGSQKLFPACVLKVEEGMEVTTKSDRLLHYRRTILELLFAETKSCVRGLRGQWKLRIAIDRAIAGADSCAAAVSQSEAASGFVTRTVCRRSQSLHPVYALRKSLRGNRGCTCMGHHRAGN